MASRPPQPSKDRNRIERRQPPRRHWLRNFYILLCLAFALFVSFQIFFAPAEITRRVREILEPQKEHYNIQFREASLRLFDGALPQLAVELDDVSFAMQVNCDVIASNSRNELPPAVKMARLRVPFRFWRLLTGHVEAGEIQAEDVMIDLDRLKDPCLRPSSAGADKKQVADPIPTTLALKSPAKAWWTESQLESLRAIMRGVHFRRVDLRFETNRGSGKQVRLEDFELNLRDPGSSEKLLVSSYIRVPAELTYGETLPPLRIDAVADAHAAEVNLKADVSEGSIESTAELTPGVDGQPHDQHEGIGLGSTVINDDAAFYEIGNYSERVEAAVLLAQLQSLYSGGVSGAI